MKGLTPIRLCMLALAAALAACASPGPEKAAVEQNSGFLRDYSSLKSGKDAQGNPVRTWVSPRLAPGTYNAILLEPVVYYPEPRATEQVSAEELRKIRDYASEALRRELAKRFVLVHEPRPGAVRLRAAISGVVARDEKLQGYQYVPIALVAVMASRAVSGTPQRAFIQSESELTDSVTGMVLARRVRTATAESGKLGALSGKQQITLEMVKPLMDELAAGVLPDMEQGVRQKAQ